MKVRFLPGALESRRGWAAVRQDEFDEFDERFERLAEGHWLVDGAVSVSDFNRRAEAALDPGRARSIGGVLLEHFGRLPAVGEGFDADGVRLTVEEMDGHRIALVRAVLQEGGGEVGEG